MTCKHKQAFSLVELMVAIGIISILVSLAVPRYQALSPEGAWQKQRSTSAT